MSTLSDVVQVLEWIMITKTPPHSVQAAMDRLKSAAASSPRNAPPSGTTMQYGLDLADAQDITAMYSIKPIAGGVTLTIPAGTTLTEEKLLEIQRQLLQSAPLGQPTPDTLKLLSTHPLLAPKDNNDDQSAS